MVAKIHDFEASDLAEPVKAALRFTEDWVLNNGHEILERRLPTMRPHYTEKQLAELAMILGFYEFAHKFNNAFGIERETDERYQNQAPRTPRRMQHLVDEIRQEQTARQRDAEG